MTAQAAIDLSLAMYESAMKECETGMNLHRKLLDGIFGQFSLKTVSKGLDESHDAVGTRNRQLST